MWPRPLIPSMLGIYLGSIVWSNAVRHTLPRAMGFAEALGEAVQPQALQVFGLQLMGYHCSHFETRMIVYSLPRTKEWKLRGGAKQCPWHLRGGLYWTPYLQQVMEHQIALVLKNKQLITVLRRTPSSFFLDFLPLNGASLVMSSQNLFVAFLHYAESCARILSLFDNCER
jgi:hypothetical protein